MTDKEHIIIIEDDTVLAAGLVRALKTEDRKVQCCGRLREARQLISELTPDLLILDVNLPDGSGFDFLEELKETRIFPIILLTANDMEADIVAGLEAGADDYITKPFSLAVLRARVNTQLRRKEKGTKRAVWTSGRYRFCFDEMEFYVDEKLVELSKNEQRLLRIFVENEGVTLSRDMLMDKIWTDGAEYVDENALSVTISRLRAKLEDNPSRPVHIQTVYGVGYLWKEE